MAKLLTKLTPEQEAQIPAIRDEFLRIGLSTEPADFDAAEQAARDAYAVAGLPAPELFIRLASPMEGAIGAVILKGTRIGESVRAQVRAQVWDQVRAQVWDQVRAQVGDQVGAQVWDQVLDQVGDQVRAQVWDQVGDQVRAQVRAQVWDQVGAQVWDQVWDQVGDQVGAQVWDQVGDQVRAQVRAQVGDQVRAQVWDQVGDQVRAQVGAAFYSQHEAGWLSWASYFHRVCNLPGAEKIEPLARIAANCGWVWFFAGAVIITDRPRILRRDDQNRLHCEDGPALEYRDGFAIHAWHGTRVPAEWVEDRASLTAKIALTWPNVDQRAAACEILGWHNIINSMNARIIDADDDPQIGRLVEIDLPDHGPQKFIHARCGTGREIAVMADARATTILEAQAASYGLSASDFIIPEIRT
jgi:hypothetical protein